MTNLLIAGLLAGGVGVWLLIAARRDDRRRPAEASGGGAVDGWRQHVAVGVAGLVAAVALVAGSGVLTPGDNEPGGTTPLLFGLLGALTFCAVLVGLGWLATLTSRRRLHAMGRAAEPVLLRGGRLRLARVAWIGISAALSAVFVANLGGL